mgnify:CR=1 FL=1
MPKIVDHDKKREEFLLASREVIAEEGLTSLMAPVIRVSGHDTVMPLFKLEQQYMPSVEQVIAAANKVMEY